MDSFQSFIIGILALFSLVSSRPQDDMDSIFNKQKECSVKEDGSGLTKPCHFPFIFNNHTYYGCTLESADEGGKPWCSTKQNQLTHEHISGGGYYGDCTDDCPSNEVGMEVHDNLIDMMGKYLLLCQVFLPEGNRITFFKSCGRL